MRSFLSLFLLYSIVSHAVSQDAAGRFIQPIATTVQLPTFGVSFDADGVLQLQTFTDPTGQLVAKRLAAAQIKLQGNLLRPAALRKVSIVRLEAELAKLIGAGKDPTDIMQKLAGLTRITSIFCYPNQRDIIIAGPAEPWIEDLAGTAVGVHSGRPTLLLSDLAVALRAYRPRSQHRGFVGCTINPRQAGLAKLLQFQKRIPRSISEDKRNQVTGWVAAGVRDSLGMAEVEVFGISPQTHFARVMIEADYRMKRIALGVEPPPVPMTTFAAALTTAAQGALQRWWFTPAYDGVRATPDRLAMQIDGQGVQLKTENKEIRSDGAIVDAGRKPTRATRAYATSFTRHYDAISKASPIYAQLRQLTNLLIVAAYLRNHDWYGRTGWNAATLLEEKALPVNTLHNPAVAPVVVNAFWKGQRMFTPAGGGVSIVAETALDQMTDDPQLVEQHETNRPRGNLNSWWWD